mgnify:CR=1 FL=1
MSLRTLMLLGAVLCLSACSKINQENYARLQVGMPRAEVEALLGAPTECSGARGLGSCSAGSGSTLLTRTA